MKNIKSILLIAFSLVCAVAFAQEKKELKAIPDGWMPQQGDIALGISAKPLLNYAGNFFNGNPNNKYIEDNFGGEPIASHQDNTFIGYQPSFSVMGKYQFTDDIAIRANIGFLGHTAKYNAYVTDYNAQVLDPLSQDKVTDTKTVKESGASFAIGAEKQRRYRKIQGFAGASLYYAFGKQNAKWAYGNAFSELNQDPLESTAPDLAQPTFTSVAHLANARVLEARSIGNKNANAFGVVGHVGVEWFFAPKVSVGGEVNLSLVRQWQPQQYVVLEGFNTATLKVEEYTQIQAPGNTRTDYSTTNLGGNIFINFYF